MYIPYKQYLDGLPSLFFYLCASVQRLHAWRTRQDGCESRATSRRTRERTEISAQLARAVGSLPIHVYRSTVFFKAGQKHHRNENPQDLHSEIVHSMVGS